MQSDPQTFVCDTGDHIPHRATSHGELDLPDDYFIRISPGHRLITFGLGMSLLSLIRDPRNAGGTVGFGSTGKLRGRLDGHEPWRLEMRKLLIETRKGDWR